VKDVNDQLAASASLVHVLQHLAAEVQGQLSFACVTPPMPSRKIARWAALGCAALAGLNSCDGPQEPEPPEPVEITVISRNVYLGTDLDPLLSTTNLGDLAVVAAAEYANVEATNFPERAGALAREIEESGAHLVGLQETALYRVQSPGDAASGGTSPATEVTFDFLELLLDSLTARGLTYFPAAVQQTVDLEVPALLDGAPPASDLRFADREAILARSDVVISDPRQGVYAAADIVSAGGLEGPLLRGHVSVLARVGGQSFRFASTHLEGSDLVVQQAQAAELLAALATESTPVVLVGDFNAAPGGDTYQQILAAGYQDAWSATGDPGDPGYTCCFPPDLRGGDRVPDQRIDLVFASSDVEPLSAEVLGEDPGDLTGSSLRPSDHAGLAATLRVGVSP
jgi:hypothetical protein